MSMFITKIQIEKTTSPRVYVTGSPTTVYKEGNGSEKNFTNLNNQKVEVEIKEYNSLDEIRNELKRLKTVNS